MVAQNLDAIRPKINDLEPAMVAMKKALDSEDAEQITDARNPFIAARNAFHKTLISADIDENEPSIAEILKEDSRLFRILSDMASKANAALRRTGAENKMKERESEIDNVKPRLPRKIVVPTTISEEYVIEVWKISCKFIGNTGKGVDEMGNGVLLGFIAKLIGFAIFMSQNPDALERISWRNAADTGTKFIINNCKQLLEAHGDELRKLAEESDNDDWVNIAQRIGEGKLADHRERIGQMLHTERS